MDGGKTPRSAGVPPAKAPTLALPTATPTIPAFQPIHSTSPFPNHSRAPTPSFPRKRESKRSHPSSPPEIKYESQSTNPLSLYGRGLG